MNKIRVKGIRTTNYSIRLQIPAKYKKVFHEFFSMELDLDTIQQRKKEEKK